jgi:hypothetical protein
MSTIKANTLLHSDGTTTTQPSIPALDKRMAKAWVNFNGSGTVAINGAYNVSSITDGGTGVFDVNFATAMANTNYVAVPTIQNNRVTGLAAYATTSIRVLPRLLSGTSNDTEISGVIIFQ